MLVEQAITNAYSCRFNGRAAVRDTNAQKRLEALPEEARLVQQAVSGNRDAFAQLYDACIDRVYRYIYFRVSDQETAEDLTSQVFLKAWEKLDHYRPKGPFMAWLYAIARNTVIDFYRTQKQTVPLDDAAPIPAASPDPDDLMQLEFDIESVQQAMKQLTGEQQEVLILKFIAEFDTAQIARRMGKSQGAIRALQMRALQALSRIINVKEQR
jgi:RNA polymerase sigma-70 factor (ECF subfamily)